MEKASAGTPPQIGSLMPGADETVEQDGTSHISIVDRQGNVIAMTTTIESGFGSRLWAAASCSTTR